jgi:hypothetical protein
MLTQRRKGAKILITVANHPHHMSETPHTNEQICPSCGSVQRAEARFCDQCGATISSAGIPTLRLVAPPARPLGGLLDAARRLIGGAPTDTPDGSAEIPTMPFAQPPPGVVPIGGWGTIDGYALAVYRALRGIADDDSANLVIEVEYRSRSAEPLRCSPFHWALHDAQGYVYTCATYNGTLLGEHTRRLPDDLVLPDRSLRGWVAFGCPIDAPVSHVRFRESVHARSYLEFALPEPEYRNLARS